ncbi:MAG: hypothetical protein LH470_00550 [Lysobacter sp.]|nr:hypothetical protein [Lysobacter sp.]
MPATPTNPHVWRVGKDKFAWVVSLVTLADVDVEYFRKALSIHEELVHATVEVQRVPHPLVEPLA